MGERRDALRAGHRPKTTPTAAEKAKETAGDLLDKVKGLLTGKDDAEGSEKS